MEAETATADPRPLALITGASRGLGAALAEDLARRGWHVVAVARTTGGLEALDDRIRELGGSATLAPMDIGNDEAMRQLCLSIYQRWGRVDLWAHCAIHAAPLSPAAHIDAKEWDRSITTNIRATGVLIQMVEPLLRAAPGRAGAPGGTALFFDDPQTGQPYFGAYGAAKAAQIALARAWQAETGHLGPQIHIVTPTPMATATRARFHPGQDRDTLAIPRTEARRLLDALPLFEGDRAAPAE